MPSGTGPYQPISVSKPAFLKIWREVIKVFQVVEVGRVRFGNDEDFLGLDVPTC